MNETRDTSNLICPYCGTEEGDMWEERENSGTRTCEDCGKKFTWEREVTCEYIGTSDCKDNGEEHDFEEDDWLEYKENPSQEFTVNNCNKCCQYEVKQKNKDGKK